VEEDHKIGRLQVFQSGDIVLFEFIFFSFLRIDRHRWIDHSLLVYAKENSAIKAMMLAKDSGHHGHSLFTAVFLIGGN
jgi:hypothetical protein